MRVVILREREVVIPSEARNLQFNCGSLVASLLGMTNAALGMTNG